MISVYLLLDSFLSFRKVSWKFIRAFLDTVCSSFAKKVFFCPTCPSPAGGSLIHSQALALSKRARDVTALQCCLCPTCPSPAGGSLIPNQAFPLTIKGKDVTALRCSEPLRSKVGGASKPSPYFAGWDRLGTRTFKGKRVKR